MKTIKYMRHEYINEPRSFEHSLLAFIYDIPYFGACGIFPPFHILNQIFLSGGGDGGMSPGASWEPFTISKEEYHQLCEAVKNTPVSEIKPYARYAWIPMKFDSEFYHIEDQNEWMRIVCEKHRDSWHAELKKIDAIE
jgi:hypothetical protein